MGERLVCPYCNARGYSFDDPIADALVRHNRARFPDAYHYYGAVPVTCRDCYEAFKEGRIERN